jgi:hypothetical protein
MMRTTGPLIRERLSKQQVLISVVCVLLCTSMAAHAQEQPSADAVNDANNPLTPAITVNFQDQYAPQIYGDPDADSNAFLLRGVIPHRLFGMPQVLRGTLPVTTIHTSASGRITGLGDLNLFDLFLFKEGALQVGVGPQLTVPTASKDATGTGKWQGGAAVVAVAPQGWGLMGALLTWQHSFAGDGDRATQNNLSAQPIAIYNLPDGWYLRSSATWNFDLAQNEYAIPIGAGVGKVWILEGGKTVNAFVEPQWTVSHRGDGQPQFQVFAGVNLQFPIGK